MTQNDVRPGLFLKFILLILPSVLMMLFILLINSPQKAARYTNPLSDLTAIQKKSVLSTKLDARKDIVVRKNEYTEYPYQTADPDSKTDPLGYLYRECTSYVAWKRKQTNTLPIPEFWGNAVDWSMRESTSDIPHSGSMAIFAANRDGVSKYGHVAYVESVEANGTITISEFNWYPYQYSVRSHVPTNGLRFIR